MPSLFRNPIKPRPGDPLTKIADQRLRQQQQQQLGGGKPPAQVRTGPPPPTVGPPAAPTDDQRARDRAIAIAKDKSRQATIANGGPPAAPGNVRQDAISRLDQQQKAERQATMDQLAASRAQQQQNAGARSGLGGFGLSGASATLQGDTARVADRNSTLALADLDKRQRDEQFGAIKQQEVLDDLETSEDRDVDHDGFIAGEKVGGKIGDGNPDNNPADNPADQRNQDRAELNKIRDSLGLSGDGGDFSPYTGTVDDAQALKDAGLDFKDQDCRLEGGTGDFFIVVRGADGKLYKFSVPDDVAIAGGNGTNYQIGARVLESLGLA